MLENIEQKTHTHKQTQMKHITIKAHSISNITNAIFMYTMFMFNQEMHESSTHLQQQQKKLYAK